MNALLDTPHCDKDLALAHVELLTGAPNTKICVRLFHEQNKNRKAYKFFGTINELLPRIGKAQNDGYGAFIVVNDGGDTDAEITSVRACFIDADNVALPA